MVGPKNAAFAEESAEVEVLLASLTKTRDLTKRIASSLSRLDASGTIVRDAIGPIYSNTQQLQITSRNIARVNEAIERLRQPLDTRGQEESIIRAGPKAGGGLPQYLSALKRVDKALGDMTSSNLRANQGAIAELSALLAMGVGQLHDLYRGLLQEDTLTLEPLHFITKGLAFPTIPAERCQVLAQVAGAIVSAGAQAAKMGQRDEDIAGKFYAEVRGEYVNKSLQNLATASVSTVKVKKDEGKVYKQGDSGIGAYAQGLEGMILAEHENTSRIFRGDSPRMLSLTCGPTLATFSRTLTELNRHIKARLLSDCFLAYEILELITPLSYRIDSQTNALRPQFSDALRQIRDTARNSLGDVITQTRAAAEAVPSLPPDGSPIALVNQTCLRLQAFSTFDRPVLTLLSSLGDGGWRSTSSTTNPASQSALSLELTPSTENPTLLSHYLLDILTALLDPLTSRAATLHRTKPLQGIFLLNSTALLARAISTHPDLARYLSISPHAARLDAYRKSAASLYLSAWREPSAHLLDTISTAKTPQNSSRNSGALDSTQIIKSLSSKDKDKIKEKFKAFNASFEECVARHKSMYMEKEVKGGMAREVTAMIEPLYARFWDRYHEVDKGKGKCVKYGKGELSAVLAGL